MDNKELYDNLKNYKIEGDYLIFGDKDGDTYHTDLIDLINYIMDYYDTDAYICNQDGLCDYIESLASSYDLNRLVYLFDDLDTDNIENEWFIVDYRFNVSFFNDIESLAGSYDLADILEELLDCHCMEDYCTIHPKEEF